MIRINWHLLSLLLLLVAALCGSSQRAFGAQPPSIVAQPSSQVVIAGTNYSFSVTATGSMPLNYQWRFNGTDLSGQSGSILLLMNIQTNNAGPYAVVVSNVAGSITSSPAILVVHTTNDPVYAPPNGGWAYIYGGDGASPSVNNGLDGTWNRQNGTDSWFGDGRGPNNGLPGGIGATNGILTIEDDVTVGTSSLDNRRFYLTHNLAQEPSVTNATTLLNDGMTLTFRARLTPPPPADPLTELTNAPSGFVNVSDGKGMFGIRQAGSGGMLISFSLNQAIEDLSTNTSFNFAQAGLHMNNLNGNVRSPNVDPGEGGVTNLLALDPTVFHEFWITIQDNGPAPGTHQISIYVDGSKTPSVFNVTAGTGSDGPATNYLALGLPSTPQRGAVDIEFFGYKPGLILPAGFDDPVGILVQPTNQFIAAGQAAIFNVGVTGSPPYSFQWYENGVAVNQATNASYTTAPATAADDGAAFTVVIANLFNSVTSSPPAILSLLPPPVIVTQPQSITVTNGDPAIFSVTIQSEAAVTYHWRFNGANVPGETNLALTINNTQLSNAGSYDVVVSNNGGSVTSVLATLTINAFDFGDAPAPYPTLLSNNGARHLIVPGVYLGAGVDAELDGQPNATATGDADEDGVTFTTALFAGRIAAVQVVASTNGFLDAWIDFNGNGSWADAGDQVFSHQGVVAGTNLLSFLVPPGATAASTFARFRFSTAGGLSFDGPAANGEVEDYAVSVSPVADLAVTQVGAPDPVAVNGNLVYSITVLNRGPSAATGVTLTNSLPGAVNFISALSSQGSCVVSGGTVACALGALSANSSATVTITVVPTSTGPLTDTSSVAGNELDFLLSNNTASSSTTIEAPPAITTQPISQTLTQGNNVILSVAATGTAPLLYQWQLNGSALSGQTNASLAINNAQLSDAGAYTVWVRNRVGELLSAPASLSVLAPPLITRQPQSQTNFAGSVATLSVTATGSAPLTYQWFFNQTNPLPGATNITLVLTNVQKVQAGNYTVALGNSAGAATSQVAVLTVFEMDFGDAPDPPYPTLLAGNGARHRIVPGFYLGSGVDFEPDGQPNATATGDDLNGSADEDGVSFLTPLRAGQLASISVLVSTNGLLNAWMDFNGHGSWAEAGDQIFTNQPLAAGTNFLSFRVPALVKGTNSFARFRFSSQANLSFVGEAPDGEVEDYAVALNAAVDLAVSVAAQPNPVAVGSNLTYTILLTNRGPSTATGVTFNDLLPQSAAFISAASSGGSCANSGGTVTCLIGSLPAGAGAAVTVICSPTAAGILTNSANVTGVEYDVNLLNNADSSTVPAMNYPVILAQPQSLTVTNGASASFGVSASGTALHFQWRLNGTGLFGETNSTLFIASAQPAQAGSYSVLVSNGVGAVLSDAATLAVLLPPQITVLPRSQTGVAGSTVQLSVAASGTAPLHYQWRLDGAELAGETRPTLTLSNLQPSQAGAYTVLVSNSAGSVLSDPPAILVVLVPPAIVQQPQTHTDYAGGQSLLTVIATGTEPLSYQWYFNGTNALAGAANATLVLTNVQKAQSGNYFVVVTNSGGAATSLVASLTVLEMDFGDAPDVLGYPTLLLFNGARHQIVPGIHLGATVDFEPDGQPNATATGDNDDDGVIFTSPLLVGQNATVDLVASTNGFLDAWIDFNSNGTWSEPGEQIFMGQPLSVGTNHLSFAVPAWAVPSNTFSRFRFSTAGLLFFDGPASDGEVEDYQVTITPVVDLGISLADSPHPVVARSNLTYTITVTNQGPSTATAVTVLDQLPAAASFVTASSSQGACTNNGDTLNCQLGALASGSQAVITLVIAPQRPGLLTNAVRVAANELELNLADNVAAAASTVIAISPPFVNPGRIDVPDLSAATPYPATIFVSGPTATVYKVTVTLKNLSHTFPSDLVILLVGPGGQSVVLMANAGTMDSENIILVFDDDSPLVLPQTGRLVSETFKPANYGFAPGVLALPSPAPPPPYGAQLSVFQGTDPNGLWSLFVLDDQLDDRGFIAGGWSLTLATLNPISDLSLGSFFAPNPVAVGSNLVYTITLTNLGPADASGVTLANRLPAGLNLVSLNSSQGSCTNQGGVINCAVGNLPAGGLATVTLTVQPTLAGAITNIATVSGNEIDLNLSNNVAGAGALVKRVTDLSLAGSSFPEPVPLFQNVVYVLTVTNRGPNTASAVGLTDTLPDGFSFVSATSSQGSCANVAGTVFCGLGNLASGASASVTITAMANRMGTIVNPATVTSGELDLNLADNVLAQISSVVAMSDPFSNPGALGITNAGAANPYPSMIQVSGLTATVYQVSVTLSNLSHSFPDDLDVLLAGPNGQKTLLMSHAGGSQPISNVTLTLDDNAPLLLPDSGQIVSGIFKPSAFGPQTNTFPAPAPAGPYEARLSVFSGADPNGAWSLYVMAEQPHEVGLLSGGWGLKFVTVDPIADLGINLMESTEVAVAGSNLSYTLLITNSGPATATGVTLSDSLPANVNFISVLSSQGGCANESGLVTCALGSLGVGSNATVTVVVSSTVAGAITNSAGVTSRERDFNLANNFASVVAAAEDAPAFLLQPQSQTRTNTDSANFSASATGTAPLQYQWQHNGGDLLGATRQNLSLSNLALVDAGSYQVRASNRVGSVLSAPAILTVLSRPTISVLPDAAIDEDTAIGISFTVADAETPAESLVVAASSSNPLLVPNGNLTLGGSGNDRTLALQPAPDQFGAATITITVSDSDGLAASSTFVLTVRSVNDPPVISGIADQTVNEDSPTEAIAFTVGDVETAAASLVISGHSSNPALMPDANIILGGSGPNRTVRLIPAADGFGTATITLTVTDGDGGSTGTSFGLTVNPVNDPPTLDPIGDLAIDEDSGLHTLILTGISSGAPNENQLVVITATGSNPGLITNLFINYTAPATNAVLSFQTVTNANGTANITVTLDDGGASNNITRRAFTVTVNPVNDPPTISGIADQGMDEDTAIGPIPFTIGDVETTPGNLLVNGTSSNTGLVSNAGISFGGSGANRTVKVVPLADQFGTTTITLRVSDESAGAAVTDFELTVNPVNDPPTLDVVSDVTINGDAGSQLLVVTGISSGARNEFDTLSLSAVSSNPALIPNPTVDYTSPNGFAALRFAPLANSNGVAAITVALDDGQPSNNIATRTFAVTVLAINHPPAISAMADQVVDQNAATGPLSFVVADADTPAAGLVVAATSSNPALLPISNIIFSGSGSNRTVNLTPIPNQFGSATITLTVTDGGGSSTSAGFGLTVNPVNAPPTLGAIADLNINEDAGAQAVSLTGIGSGAATENQILVITASSSNPAVIPDPTIDYSTPNPAGTLRFAALPNASGAATITVTVNDGQAANNTATRSFKVTVNPVNDPPTLDPITDLTLDEDAGPRTINLTGISAGAADENQTLVVSASSSNPAFIPSPTVNYTSPSTGGLLTLASLTNASGAAIITVTVNDGGASNNLVSRSFTVTVNAVNDPPVIGLLSNLSVMENMAAGPIAVVVGDVDTPLTNLLLSANSSNPSLVSSANILFGGSGSNRSMTLRPFANQFGTATITVKVSDGPASATTSFVLTVLATNQPPTISSLAAQTISQGAGLSLPFAINDIETAAASLVVTGSSSNPSLVPGANLVFGGNGANRNVTITPASNQVGAATITITVNDGVATASSSFVLTVDAVPPLITTQPQSQTVSNGATVAFSVTASGTPPLNLQWQFNGTNLPGATNLTLTLTNVPLAKAGPYVAVVSNSAGSMSSAPAILTVKSAITPPAISNIPDQVLNEDTSLTVPFTVGLPESAPFSLVFTTTSTNTALVDRTNIFFGGSGSNRTLTILPNTNQFGAILISVTVDNGVSSASDTFLLTVNPVNDPPTLDPIADYGTVVKASQQSILLTGISSGAFNEAQTLSVTASSSALFTPSVSYTNGSATGVLRFTPGNSSGSATVTVTVNDGGGSNNIITRAFSVFVASQGNARPTISSLANIATLEDTPAGPISFVVGDSGTPAASLALRVQSSNPVLAPTNNIVFGGGGSNRTVTITPALNQTGTSTITITVLDSSSGAASGSFVLTVTPVNDPPAISIVADQTINEDTLTAPIAFTVSDPETPAGSLIVTGSSSNPALVPNANIFFGGGGANRLLVVRPATNQSGTATITLTVSDGGSNRSTSFVLTVVSVNDPPAISAIADQTTSLGTATAPIPVTVGDVETAAGNLSLSGASSNPTVAPAANIVFGGSGSNRTVTVTPAAGQSGTAAITVTVADTDGGTASSSYLLRVNANPTNVSPALDPLSNVVLNEGAGPQVVTLTGITAGTNERQSLAISATSSNPGLIPNPIVTYTSPNTTGTVSFVLLPATNGTATLTLTVNDGQSQNNLFAQTFTVTVNPKPGISDIADQVTNEDAATGAIPFTVSDAVTPAANLVVVGSSSNPALVPIANIVFGGSAASRTVTLTPAADQFGFAIISLTVTNTNGNSASTSFVLTVSPVNDPPTLDPIANMAFNEDAGPQTIALTGISSGAANELQNLTVTALSSNPSLIPNPAVNYISPGNTGALTFASRTNANGTALITVTVSDGQTSNSTVSRNFAVMVNPVNDPPTLSVFADQVTTENTATGPIPFVVGDVDNGAASLVVSGNSSNPSLVPNANITFAGSGSNRTVNVLPATNQFGAATITVTVSDGAASAANTFLLTVNAANNPPAITGLADQIIDEDAAVGPISFTVSDVETLATDLVVTASSSNPGLVSSTNILLGGSGANRSVTIAPLPNQFGTGVIHLTVTDGNGATASASFRLTVNPVNDPPTLNSIGDVSITEDAGPQYLVLSGITSGAANENQSLTVTASHDNPALIANLAVSYVSPETAAILTFTPSPDANGSAVVTVTVNDGGSSNNIVSRSFTVTVLPVNHPPTISDIPAQVTDENIATGPIPFTVNDLETAGGDLVVAAVSFNSSLVPAANITLGGGGNSRTINLLPAANQSGTAIILVTVSDGIASAENAFLLTVNPVNGPPPVLRISRAGAINRLSLATQSGRSYVVEYKNSLGDPTWTPLSTVVGSGAMAVVTDTAAPAASRFYRVRTE